MKDSCPGDLQQHVGNCEQLQLIRRRCVVVKRAQNFPSMHRDMLGSVVAVWCYLVLRAPPAERRPPISPGHPKKNSNIF